MPPSPIHHSGVILCVYYRIYFCNVYEKEKITAGKLNCQIINYCTLGNSGNLGQKEEFSILEPIHCCRGENKSFWDQ